MNRKEFAICMAYLSAGVGKEMSEQQAEVYFDLLGDLPYEVLQAAVKRVLLAHPWPSFPSIAELREAAVETAAGRLNGTARLAPPALRDQVREFGAAADKQRVAEQREKLQQIIAGAANRMKPTGLLNYNPRSQP